MVKTAMGPVFHNHCQIRRAKAEPADGYSTVTDQLEIASTHLEQDQERQPPNVDSTGEIMPSTPRIESEDMLPATIERGPRRSQRERRLPSRFRDYVLIELVSETTSSRDCLIGLVLFSFSFACFWFACFFF